VRDAVLSTLLRRVLVIWMVLAVFVSVAARAEPIREDVVKAAFLYRFTTFVEWPESALRDKVFTIGVLGESTVTTELRKLVQQRPIGTTPTEVRFYSKVSDIGEPQMLYVSSSYRGSLAAVVAKVGSQPILLVTDRVNGLEAGSIVNFLIVDRRVRFEISIPAAERSGIRLGSDLLSVAARVIGTALRLDGKCEALPGEYKEYCFARVASL
jgi:hypothetical protein